MPAVRMDGRALAAKLKDQVRRAVEQMERRPGLAVILAGDSPAARTYAGGKKRDCEQCGIYSEEYLLPDGTGQEELLELIAVLNEREDIDGILVQHPLPEGLNEKEVLLAIRPDKDIDCFHPFNMGRLTLGEPGFRPCTPAGVVRLLEEYGIDPAGKRCVIVGRSNIVGKPQALMMMEKNATVTVCHTGTRDLKAQCRQAEILISAAGQLGLISGEMIREGAVVVDVATNRDGQGRLRGDVIEEEAEEKASYLTPVPGGVGPMTRAMLMENTLLAARRHGK